MFCFCWFFLACLRLVANTFTFSYLSTSNIQSVMHFFFHFFLTSFGLLEVRFLYCYDFLALHPILLRFAADCMV